MSGILKFNLQTTAMAMRAHAYIARGRYNQLITLHMTDETDDDDPVRPKYRFVPISEDTRNQLLQVRENLDSIDADELSFTEPPYLDADNADDLVKREVPHDPHRSPERKFDKTVRKLVQLARSHPDVDVEVDILDAALMYSKLTSDQVIARTEDT